MGTGIMPLEAPREVTGGHIPLDVTNFLESPSQSMPGNLGADDLLVGTRRRSKSKALERALGSRSTLHMPRVPREKALPLIKSDLSSSKRPSQGRSKSALEFATTMGGADFPGVQWHGSRGHAARIASFSNHVQSVLAEIDLAHQVELGASAASAKLGKGHGDRQAVNADTVSAFGNSSVTGTATAASALHR